MLSMRELDRNASGRGKPQLMIDGGQRANKKVCFSVKFFCKSIFQDGDFPRALRHLELEGGKPQHEYLRLFGSPRRS